MLEITRCCRLAMFLLVVTFGAGVDSEVHAAGSTPDTASANKPAVSPKPDSQAKRKPDLTGHKRTGKASFYARKFTGKKMADGTKMDPHDDNAASKTLPLGTTAKVTNVETGQSTDVTIQDRGPYVKGRIVDLSPSSAKKIGITPDEGVADVKVEPIAVPQPDGSVKPGVATHSEDK